MKPAVIKADQFLENMRTIGTIVDLRLTFETNLLMWLELVNRESGYIVSTMAERLKAIREHSIQVQLNGTLIDNMSTWETFKGQQAGVDREIEIELTSKQIQAQLETLKEMEAASVKNEDEELPKKV